jgi:hypothetical protein
VTGDSLAPRPARREADRLPAAGRVEPSAPSDERWAHESGISNAAWQARWEAEHRPLVRELHDEDLSPELLDPVECERVARLAAVDPDDVPSVILSLVLGAFFLSEDSRAVRAVFGSGVDLEAHLEWLEVLRAGGDAGELVRSIFVTMGAPFAGVAELFSLSRWLAQRFSPWLPVSLGVAIARLLRSRVSSESWQNLRGVFSDAAEAFAHMYWQYQDAFERFRRAAAPAPTWKKLARTNERKMVLARACLYTLARSSTSPMPAGDLEGVLPELEVGQGEKLVREVLRSNGCFAEPYPGRWQVGVWSVPVPGGWWSVVVRHEPRSSPRLATGRGSRVRHRPFFVATSPGARVRPLTIPES